LRSGCKRGLMRFSICDLLLIRINTMTPAVQRD
jgi:hypothetical protein